MLKRIESIKDFGVFRGWKADSDLPNFEQYNLVYGANGSGKSTLGRLLDRLGGREFDSDDSRAQFSVAMEDDSRLTQASPRMAGPVHVFNKQFEERNINWDERVESILLVSEDRITDRENLEALKTQVGEAAKVLRAAEAERKAVEARVDKFWAASAKAMKEVFLGLGTHEPRYQSYSATKLRDLCTDRRAEVTAGAAVLEPDVLEQTRLAARAGEPKPALAAPGFRLDLQELRERARKVSALLATSAASRVVERLRERPEIGRWVEAGLAFHDHAPTTCEFCASPLSEARLGDLQAHFSAAFNELKRELEAARTATAQARGARPATPSGEALYPELAEEYAARVAALDAAWAVYERWLEGCASALGRKLANPLDVSIAPPALDDDAVDSVNRAIERVNEHVQAHNDKTRAFAAQVSRAMRKLELHFASEYLQDGVQEASIAAKEQLTTEISAQGIRVAHLEGEVAKLEAELSSPALGAAEFNAKLHRFLGRDDLSLVFDPAQKGYQIERTHGRPAKNLSEGEKTAIAFIYFITKLHEQGNRVEDTIVVLDDPISSFDSNHLFGAFSYITEHCQRAKQLFVLTHNFGFYCQVRRWMLGKNKTRKGVVRTRAAFFLVESAGESPREASLRRAPGALLEYDTEYHHLFARLWALSSRPQFTGAEAFDAGNIARRVLETFVHFKFPKERNDFRTHLWCVAGKDPTPEQQQVLEQIYRFINHYSHSGGIALAGGGRDNLLSEGPTVVKLVLGLIKGLDPTHHDEMVAMVSE